MPVAPALPVSDTERAVVPCPVCDTAADGRCAACNSTGWMVVRQVRQVRQVRLLAAAS